MLEYNFLNSSVALFGYYFAAFTVDKPWMGRRRMQLMGFVFIFVIFLIGGAAFNQLTANKTNLSWFQVGDDFFHASRCAAPAVLQCKLLLAACMLHRLDFCGRCWGGSHPHTPACSKRLGC